MNITCTHSCYQANAMASGSGDYHDIIDPMCGNTFRMMEVRMRFVPSVKESLLSKAKLLIYATICKETMPPFMYTILSSLKLIR